MLYNPHDSIKVAIEDLGVGMFVTSIEHNKLINLSKAGRVTSPQAIKTLRDNKVKYVWVDQELSSDSCEDSIKVAVKDLGVGMFVTEIEHNKQINLAKAGRVASPQAIETLRDSKVKYVWVDQELSSASCEIIPIKTIPVEKFEPSRGKAVRRSRTVQQRSAKVLIVEAKSLAKKILSSTFDTKKINISIVDKWADNMIESVLVDSDALQCVSALRNKDTYLLEHSVNIACLLITFGKYIKLDRNSLKQVAIGGILHDIGKTRVDDEVLHKPGKLTDAEFEHMKMHQTYAKELIANIKGLGPISRDICLMHHEKLNGKGYPNGLSGDQIPLHARMCCIVDIYDALTAERCYKTGMSPTEAFKILLSLTPFHLDTELVYKFINCIGVYPVGSIVELNDGRIGIVWSANVNTPLKPEIKCFYSNKYKHFIDVVMVDLKNTTQYKILRAVSPLSLNVNPTPFYD